MNIAHLWHFEYVLQDQLVFFLSIKSEYILIRIGIGIGIGIDDVCAVRAAVPRIEYHI